MLRVIVIGLGVVSLVAAAALLAIVPTIWPASVELAVFGVLVLIGTFFERRYRGRQHAKNGEWQTTGERFVDPASGKLTEVKFNAQTGERAYVAVDAPTAPSPK